MKLYSVHVEVKDHPAYWESDLIIVAGSKSDARDIARGEAIECYEEYSGGWARDAKVVRLGRAIPINTTIARVISHSGQG